MSCFLGVAPQLTFRCESKIATLYTQGQSGTLSLTQGDLELNQGLLVLSLGTIPYHCVCVSVCLYVSVCLKLLITLIT